MSGLYLPLALAGFTVPYYFFLSFLIDNGLDIQLLVERLFASDISNFFAVDLLITAVVLLVFSNGEARRYQMTNWWAYALAMLFVRPSISFPIFLYGRERHLDQAISVHMEE